MVAHHSNNHAAQREPSVADPLMEGGGVGPADTQVDLEKNEVWEVEVKVQDVKSAQKNPLENNKVDLDLEKVVT